MLDWTNINYVGGNQNCFTCHTQTIEGGIKVGSPGRAPLVQAAVAIIRVCLAGTGQVRLVSYYFDSNGNPVLDRGWVQPFVCRPQFTVDNQTQDITAHFNAAIGPSPQQQIFTLEVNGVGNVYMGRLEINWAF